MNNKKTTKQYILFVIGLAFFSLGLCFANRSLLGANPMGVFVFGLSVTLGISFGTANFFVNIFEVTTGYILDKKNVTIASILSVILGSYLIDFAALFIPATDSLVIRIIYMILGVLSYCLGIAIQQHAQCGYGGLDCFIFGLAKLFKIKEYYRIRWIVDGLFLLTGYLLHSVINVGTLILVLFGGIIIQNMKKVVDKLSIGRWKDWD